MSEAFSLTTGGRVHAALVRAGMAGGARGRLMRVGVMLALCWLPLALFAAAAGTVLPGTVELPLLTDISVWARYFIVVPVLVLAEPFADRWLGRLLDQFRRGGIVAGESATRFDAEVGKAQDLATNDLVELGLALVALTVPHVLAASSAGMVGDHTAWYGTPEAGGVTLSAAGRWAAWVSLPLVEYLLLRWLWRILAWWRLVWRISRLPLSLAPSHPDRAGGLGFFSYAPNAFVPVFVGISALASATIAAQLLHNDGQLQAMRAQVVAFLVMELILLVVPQLFFAPAKSRARREALVRFEVTGVEMSRAFETRWTDPGEGPDPLLDSGHPGSMADFGTVYERVAAMRPLTVSVPALAGIVIPLAAPFLPLLLFQYSVAEILQNVLKLVR